MKRRSKWTCLLLAVVFLFSMGGRTAHAEEYWPEGPQIAGESGVDMVIANGDDVVNISRILEGKEVGTLFKA